MFGKISHSMGREKLALLLSGAAWILLTAPAWISGFCAAAVAAAVWAGMVWWLPVSAQRLRALGSQGPFWALAAFLGSGFAVNFYHTWCDSRYVALGAKALGLPAQILTGALAVAGTLAALPGMTMVLTYFINTVKEDYLRSEQSPKTTLGGGKSHLPIKAFRLLLLVFLLGISALLRANFYYQDDTGRGAYGYKQWDYFGRYLSTGLSTLVHMGDYLTDIAPLPQILAMAVMALTAVAVLYVLLGRRGFTLWEIGAVIPLGLNPYFLECLSFRFDAPYMALSLLAAVAPLLLRNRRPLVYVFAAMVGTLAVCTSYQSSAGIFPMLVILLALRMWCGGQPFREAVRFCLRSAAGYGLGMVYFKMIIMKPADAGYVSNALPEVGRLLPNLLENLGRYYRLVLTDWKLLWLLLTLAVAVCFVWKLVRESKRGRLPTLAMALLALGLMGVLAFGVYPALASPLFAPRAMYGFAVLVALLAVCCGEGKRGMVGKACALVLSWAFFVFGFTYGNALSQQKAYTEFRIQLVMEDLNELPVFQEEQTVEVQLSGSIGRAPVIENMPQNYKMLQRLIPDTLAGGDDLTQYLFFDYYGLRHVEKAVDVDLSQLDMPILADHMYHRIRGEGNQILIELK